MTSERSVNSNKAALRASLKKEDESLAERIVDTDVTVLVAPQPASAAPVEPPKEEGLGRPSQSETTAVAAETHEEGNAAVPAEETSPAKEAVKTGKPGRAEAQAAQAAKASKQAKSAPSAKGKAEAAKAGAASKTTNKPAVAVQEEASPRVDDGKRARGKSVKATEKRPVEVKEKREKVVHYSLDLLKSEEVAIETLRSELSKTAGRAASRSDILRAGVRLFAEQTLDRRKELLTGLASTASTAKAKKKG